MRHERSIQLIPDNINTLEPIDAAALMGMTVDDLRSWERLGGQCSACRRQGLVNAYQVKRDFGNRKLIELQRFLHCTRCDNRKDNKFVVTKLGRD